MAVKEKITEVLFKNRVIVIVAFLLLTVFFGWSMTKLTVNGDFSKLLPVNHEYIKTFLKYREDFGGANKIVITLSAKDGDIFSEEFFAKFKELNEEIFFLPGLDRTQLKSILSPSVRYTEITKDGFQGARVVPSNTKFDEDVLSKVRSNIVKSGQVGRLVSNDFSGVSIVAVLQDKDPETGKAVDYRSVAGKLENIRTKFENDSYRVSIIGYAKFVGEIIDGVSNVLKYFVITAILIFILVLVYIKSFIYALLTMICSFLAVIWQLGFISLIGFTIDPMSILVPFLIFAIGTSHGVQMINSVRSNCDGQKSMLDTVKQSFSSLLAPGVVALLSDSLGFLTMLLIDIRMIKESAMSASIGVVMIIFLNLIMLPILLSYTKSNKVAKRAQDVPKLWKYVASLSIGKRPYYGLGIFLLLIGFGLYKSSDVVIGDVQNGAPELRETSRYNRDIEFITSKFSIGTDVLSIMAASKEDACIDYEVMSRIDDLGNRISDLPEVASVISLPYVAKIFNLNWNEGYLKWRILPRDRYQLGQSVSGLETSSGLFNQRCKVMPIRVFTLNHKAETIDKIINLVKDYREEHEIKDKLSFELASGNLGVMGATNEIIEEAQLPTLLFVFASVGFLVLIMFRSIRSAIIILMPLLLTSSLAYALMDALGIGLKMFTLPVIALGVGVGIDYGIYIFYLVRKNLAEGKSIVDSLEISLAYSGKAVFFTGVTLSIGVLLWVWSPLKFQADMGILLGFLFFSNMVGAILLIPVFSRLLLKEA